MGVSATVLSVRRLGSGAWGILIGDTASLRVARIGIRGDPVGRKSPAFGSILFM